MILYLDTSALVKAYITEVFSDVVISKIEKTNVIATHMIAYVEAYSAFSRLNREQRLSDSEFDQVTKLFITDWENYLRFDINEQLLSYAAELVHAFALRAYDSIHLAAANILARETKQSVMFASFDKKLNQAAHVLGMKLLDTA